MHPFFSFHKGPKNTNGYQTPQLKLCFLHFIIYLEQNSVTMEDWSFSIVSWCSVMTELSSFMALSTTSQSNAFLHSKYKCMCLNTYIEIGQWSSHLCINVCVFKHIFIYVQEHKYTHICTCTHECMYTCTYNCRCGAEWKLRCSYPHFPHQFFEWLPLLAYLPIKLVIN